MKRGVIALASLFVLGASADAFAANACVTAADRGQDLRAAGKLDEARTQFLVCAKPACNRVVRADCERWLKEVDQEKEEKKQEKQESVPSAPPAPPPVVTPAQARVTIAISEPPSSSAAQTATFPVAPAVLGGLGVLSLAAFGYFQVQGWSRYSSLEDGCARTQSCSDSDIEGTRSQFVASGAALGVSVVSFGVAAILWLTRTPASEPSRLGVRPGGAAVSF